MRIKMSLAICAAIALLFGSDSAGELNAGEPLLKRGKNLTQNRGAEPVRDLVRATGHGCGRSVHYYNPGYHSCYYNPWSEINTPRFAYSMGEPDCQGRGCGQFNGYSQPYAYGTSPNEMLPPREITEPQFPPSKNATVEESDDSVNQNLLEGFGDLGPRSGSEYQSNSSQPTQSPTNSPTAVSVLSKLSSK